MGRWPPILVLHCGLRTTKLYLVPDSVGGWAVHPGRGCMPSTPGKGPFPKNLSLCPRCLVTPRAEAASVPGPVAGRGGSAPLSPDHLPGPVPSFARGLSSGATGAAGRGGGWRSQREELVLSRHPCNMQCLPEVPDQGTSLAVSPTSLGLPRAGNVRAALAAAQ